MPNFYHLVIPRSRATRNLLLLFSVHWRLASDNLLQICHLNRGQCGFEAFVAHLQSSAINGLFQRVTSEHAEGMGNTSFLRRLSDTARDFIHNDVIVRSVAADKASEADDGVVFFGFGERARRGGNFESAGNTDEGDVFFVDTGTEKAVESALKKAFGYKRIEAGDNKSEAFACSVEVALNRWELRFQFQSYTFHLGLYNLSPRR